MIETTIQQLAAGGTSRRRRHFYRVKDCRINCVMEKFRNGEYTLDEYIEKQSQWMGILGH